MNKWLDNQSCKRNEDDFLPHNVLVVHLESLQELEEEVGDW